MLFAVLAAGLVLEGRVGRIQAQPQEAFALGPVGGGVRAVHQDHGEEAIQRAKDANEEYDPSLETRVQSYEDWLADEGNRWQIKRETIEEFRQMVREYPLHLHAESPFLCEEGTSTYQLMRDACEKYASGLSSLDGFLAELSTKMRMVEAENL